MPTSGQMPARAVLRGACPAGMLGFGLFMAACARQPVEQGVRFSEADHHAFMAKGTATLDGEGFLRRPNAWLARCSGGKVFLMPATPYFRERMEIFRKGGIAANREEADAKVVRTTQCNMQGRFLFQNLPAGKWLVVTTISYEGEAWQDKSTLTSEVETRTGEVTKVILSNPNRIE